jgi:hypothetical protein
MSCRFFGQLPAGGDRKTGTVPARRRETPAAKLGMDFAALAGMKFVYRPVSLSHGAVAARHRPGSMW